MPPDDSFLPSDAAPPGGDWELPSIEPADELIGWAPEPALPEPEPLLPESVASEPVASEPVAPAATPEAAAPDVVTAALPASEAEEPFPVGDDGPVEHDTFAGIGAPLLAAAAEDPPSAGVLPVPRRSHVGGPVSPVRALAGAAVAVAGVLLGIGALLWATDAPKGSPALQQTQAQSSQVSSTPAPSVVPSPSPEPTTSAPAPLAVHSPVASPATAPKIALTVLNNSNVNKLAARAAAKYAAAGWPIKLTGAFRGRIPVTTVYYAPGQQASAALLQKEFPAIARVRPRFTGLPGSGLTVVLTRDYPA